MNVKTIVQGFGAAILVMILRVWPHLSRYHPVIYHSFLPMQSVVWGVLIDLAAITLLAALLFGYLEKSETGLRTVVWAFVAAELASALVNALAGMRRAPIPYLSAGRAYIITLLFALALRWLWPPAYRHAVRGFGVLLALAGCSMVWMIPQLLYQGLRPQRTDAVVPLSHLALVSDQTDPAADPGRIVWLLFDELSFDQTFEHRFPGLALPAFDSLKSKSVVFSNVKPAGYYTDRVIPSYFLGAQVNNIRSSLDGDPTINLTGKPWQAFDANATIFADAQRLGWTTGVVGWYNPYCRILAGTLNYCYLENGRRPIRRGPARAFCLAECLGALDGKGARPRSIGRPSPRQSRRRTWQRSCPRPRRCFATRVSVSFLFISPYRTLRAYTTGAPDASVPAAAISTTWRWPTDRWQR